VAAGDHYVVVAVGHEDRLADLREVVGRLQARRADRLQLCTPGLHRDALVSVLCALLQPGHVGGRRALALLVSVEEQEMPWIAQGEGGLGVRAGRDPVDLLDAAAAGGTRAGQNDPADELGVLEGDHLRDSAAEREAQEVDLVVAEGADEGDGVGGHLIDRVRHRSARRADAAVVECDHVSLGGRCRRRLAGPSRRGRP
jgi:hypothetical protein